MYRYVNLCLKSPFFISTHILFREESVGNNERVGQYSYIGDDGKTYTVKYSAGINGFRSESKYSKCCSVIENLYIILCLTRLPNQSCNI